MNILFIFFLIKILKFEIIAHFSECLNNERIISFKSTENETISLEIKKENCKECKKNEYLFYDFNLN